MEDPDDEALLRLLRAHSSDSCGRENLPRDDGDLTEAPKSTQSTTARDGACDFARRSAAQGPSATISPSAEETDDLPSSAALRIAKATHHDSYEFNFVRPGLDAICAFASPSSPMKVEEMVNMSISALDRDAREPQSTDVRHSQAVCCKSPFLPSMGATRGSGAERYTSGDVRTHSSVPAGVISKSFKVEEKLSSIVGQFSISPTFALVYSDNDSSRQSSSRSVSTKTSPRQHLPVKLEPSAGFDPIDMMVGGDDFKLL